MTGAEKGTHLFLTNGKGPTTREKQLRPLCSAHELTEAADAYAAAKNGEGSLATAEAKLQQATKAATNLLEDTAPKTAPTLSPQVQNYLNGSGGRWGGTATRQLNHAEALKLEGQGYRVTGGAGRASEEWIPGPGDGTKGGTRVDITATNGTQTTRIQTVTTLADGVTPTASEAAAAARIRAAFPNDTLILVSKQTGKVIP